MRHYGNFWHTFDKRQQAPHGLTLPELVCRWASGLPPPDDHIYPHLLRLDPRDRPLDESDWSTALALALPI
jgi:hypothetical protein